MSTSPAISRSYWSNGLYFEGNPNMVAGKVHDTFSKFGDAVKEVRGNMGDVVLVLSSLTQPAPKVNNWGVTIDRPDQKQAPAPKISEAIKATQEASEHPTTAGFEMLSFDEIRSRYAPEITDDEYKIWVAYQRDRLFSRSVILQEGNGWRQYHDAITDTQYLKYHDKGLVAYDGREWVPASIYYAGSIYDKIADIERHKEKITTVIGAERYSRQLATANSKRPRMLRLADPENERLVLKIHDPFIENVEISERADGTMFPEPQLLSASFKEWLRELPRSDFKNGSNAYDIIRFVIQRENFPRDTDPKKKAETLRKGELDLVPLYSRFLAEMLTSTDQARIEALWNREYNGWVEYDYSRIPIGFEINKWFKSGPIDPRKALWDGVRFMSANGSGVIAFDVGVGKTMTAILAIAQAMYTGQCKRPLIVVPNPTYAKWISETVGEFNEDGTTKVHGVLPQFANRVNDYYNLGVNHINNAIRNPPRDYTITFMSFEGLENLGMSNDLREEISNEMFSILNQGLVGTDGEKLREKIDKLLGNTNADTSVNIDDMGFDYLVFDEAHNAKKIFTSVKGDPKEGEEEKRNKSPYALSSGEPSGIGLKTFIISQYIMKRNKMRNICLLTATPFTNSPLEIYSMLAVVAYQNLQKRGINNIKAFFDKFVQQTSEMVYTTRGTLENRPTIKGFDNRQVLQNIIFSYMLHKTGEEANVPRPTKVVYPRVKDEAGITLPKDLQVETALPATEEQRYWMAEIAKFANKQDSAIEAAMGAHYYDPETEEVMGRDLIAVGLGRQATLSPLLLRITKFSDGKSTGSDDEAKENKKEFHYFLDNPTPTAEEFVQSSPKLQYVIQCLRTMKQWHEAQNEPMSCAVIYMNIGIDMFGPLSFFIADELGLSPTEVAAIGGKITAKKKEAIKAKFLEGKIKVIIGSATIKEGIDLQNKSTVLFNLTLDWNPTDIQQLEGRIWRQGNQHSYVRIVTPMIENSVDVFMFQKLEEKTSRINTIWYRAGRTNVLDVDKFDPRELKLGLMTDPDELARVLVQEEETRLQQKIEILEEDYKQLIESKTTIRDINSAYDNAAKYFQEAKTYLETELSRAQMAISINDYSRKADKERDERIIKTNTEILNRTDSWPAKFAAIKKHMRAKIAEYGYGVSSFYEKIRFVEDLTKEQAKLDRLQKNVLNPHGLIITDDLDPLIQSMEADKLTMATELERVKSPEYLAGKAAEHRKAREEAEKETQSVEARVKQFTTHNHLLSCLKDLHECSIDEGTQRRTKMHLVKKEEPKPQPAPATKVIEQDYWVIAYMPKGSAIFDKPKNGHVLLGPLESKSAAEGWLDTVQEYAIKNDTSGKASFMRYQAIGTKKGAWGNYKGSLNSKILKELPNLDKPAPKEIIEKPTFKQRINITQTAGDRLTSTNKRHIAELIKNNLSDGKVNRISYKIEKRQNNVYEVTFSLVDRGLGWIGDKKRVSVYKSIIRVTTDVSYNPTSPIQTRIDALQAAYEVTNNPDILTRIEALTLALELAA